MNKEQIYKKQRTREVATVSKSHFCLVHNVQCTGSWKRTRSVFVCHASFLLHRLSRPSCPVGMMHQADSFSKTVQVFFSSRGLVLKMKYMNFNKAWKRHCKKIQEYVFFHYSYLLPNFCFPSTPVLQWQQDLLISFVHRPKNTFTQGTLWSRG